MTDDDFIKELRCLAEKHKNFLYGLSFADAAEHLARLRRELVEVRREIDKITAEMLG